MKKILMALAASCLVAPVAVAAPATAEQRSVMAMEDGVWDADITFPSQDPTKPAQKAKGVQANKLRSGGMWIINEFSVEGTPYQGTGVWGYDRLTGQYSGIWVDNNDSQIRMDRGHWNPATKTMTWTADYIQADDTPMRLLVTEKFNGDVRTFRSVALTPKGEVPLVEIVFTKRPGGQASR
jgi:hypothetical protein